MTRRFLIVEPNSEGRALLSRTLLRKFPGAEIDAVDEVDAAIEKAREHCDGIVVHKAIGTGGLEVIRELRRNDAKIPIVMMSSIDRTADAIDAGASSFLPYDAWLLLGSVMDDLIRTPTVA